MIILIPDGMNLAEFEEEMTQQMFQKYFDVNFKPDEDENLLFKENIVNLTMPLFEETHVNHHLDKSLLQVMAYAAYANYHRNAAYYLAISMKSFLDFVSRNCPGRLFQNVVDPWSDKIFLEIWCEATSYSIC